MLPPMYFASPSKHIFSTSNMTKSTGKKDTASENGCFKINKYFQEVKPTRPTKDDNENRMGLASKQRGSGIANNKRKGQEKASKRNMRLCNGSPMKQKQMNGDSVEDPSEETCHA